MKRRILLHIGRHKTGTTSIQLFLDRNRTKLLESGISYPMAGRYRSPARSPQDRVAHHKLAHACCKEGQGAKDYLSEFREQLLSETKDCSTVVLSSEAFQNVSNVEVVQELFKNFNVEVICYLREYLSYVSSAYAQEIKASPIVADFNCFEKGFGLSMDSFIRRWEYAVSYCHWRLYDRSCLFDGNIVSDFVRATELPIKNDEIQAESNVSISGNLLGFKLAANLFGLHDPLYGQGIIDLAESHDRFRGPIYISSETQERIRASNSCNKILKRRFENVPEFDFERGNRILDPVWAASDFEFILSELRGNPDILNSALFDSSLFLNLLDRGNLDLKTKALFGPQKKENSSENEEIMHKENMRRDQERPLPEEWQKQYEEIQRISSEREERIRSLSHELEVTRQANAPRRITKLSQAIEWIDYKNCVVLSRVPFLPAAMRAKLRKAADRRRQ